MNREDQKQKLIVGIFVLMLLFGGCGKKNRQGKKSSKKGKVATRSAQAKPSVGNEAGRFMILVYHKIGKPEGRWQRTPEHFRKDLERLYKKGYRLARLEDIAKGIIKTRENYTPVVLTFDDASPGQFRYIQDEQGERIDPNSAVGILNAFAKKHPDFGRTATFFILWDAGFGTPKKIANRIQALVKMGYDIGNHTWSHPNLRKLNDAEVKKEIALSAKKAAEVLPHYPFDLLALPYGVSPKDEKVLSSGSSSGVGYKNRLALLVGAEPSPSPFSKEYRPFRLPRIQAISSEIDKWLAFFDRHPEARFISDGDPRTVTVPKKRRVLLDKRRVGKRKVRLLTKKNEQEVRAREPTWVKGIYMTGWVAGSSRRFEELLKMIDKTELNAVVIDVKDAEGVVGYSTEIALLKNLGAIQLRMRNLKAILHKLKEHHIYPIARIVVFKDNVLPRKMPRFAVRKADGTLWKDKKGFTWSDPYNKKVWDYNLAIAQEVAKLGFKEIQFDYIRFPSDGKAHTAVYPAKDSRSRSAVIRDFMKVARKVLDPYSVFLSVDLFGLTGTVKHDMGIGQILTLVAPFADYISPMVYPSHYARGEYGIAVPDLEPYWIVYLSLRDAAQKIAGQQTYLRPWLQAFSLHGYSYGVHELREQIAAVNAAGFSQWLLWNPRNHYDQVAGALQLTAYR